MATGMDTDYPLVPIRKYLDNIEDMVVPTSLSKVPGCTSRHLPLSPFERLPLELRQEIYGYLGFLIGGKVWRYYYPGRVYYRTTVRYFLFPRWDLAPGGSYDVMYATEHPSMQSECYGSDQVSYTRAYRPALKSCSIFGDRQNFYSSRKAFDVKSGTRCSRAPTSRSVSKSAARPSILVTHTEIGTTAMIDRSKLATLLKSLLFGSDLPGASTACTSGMSSLPI